MKKTIRTTALAAVLLAALVLWMLPVAQADNTVIVTTEQGLRAAIEEAGTTPTTIELGNDIKIANSTDAPGEPFVIGADQNITLNFKGFTIDVNNNVFAALKYLIQNEGTVALVGPGSINSRGVFNGDSGVMTVDGLTINVAGEGAIGMENAGTLTLTDVYITSMQKTYEDRAPIAIEVDGGSITVNSGTFDYSIQKTKAASDVQILVKSAVFKPETKEEQDMEILTFPEGTVEVQVVVDGKSTYTKLGPEEDVLQYLLQVQDDEKDLKKFAVISGDINLTSLKKGLEVGNNGYGQVWISDVNGKPMLVPHSMGPTEFFKTGEPIVGFVPPTPHNQFVEPTYYPDYDEEDEEPAPTEEAPTAYYRVICRTLNVRTGAGTQFERVGTLSRGTLVSGVVENGWLRFDFAGQTRYCSAAYLQKVDAEDLEALAVTCRTLNVRAGAGTNFEKIGTLSRGARIEVLDVCGNWIQIPFQDGVGYVSAAYVG
ncbi:MAG: SH3 domain-containing protein [Candidatus Spyradocola sp.]|jgi:uncharacterized protein YraI